MTDKGLNRRVTPGKMEMKIAANHVLIKIAFPPLIIQPIRSLHMIRDIDKFGIMKFMAMKKLRLFTQKTLPCNLCFPVSKTGQPWFHPNREGKNGAHSVGMFIKTDNLITEIHKPSALSIDNSTGMPKITYRQQHLLVHT